MTFAIANDWTITTNDAILIEVLTIIEATKTAIREYNELPYESVKFDSTGLHKLMDEIYYNDDYKAYYDLISSYYWQYVNAEADAYRRYAEADFLAFERANVDYARGLWLGSEKDYDMYSDWSKDIYGHRIRWRVASRI